MLAETQVIYFRPKQGKIGSVALTAVRVLVRSAGGPGFESRSCHVHFSPLCLRGHRFKLQPIQITHED